MRLLVNIMLFALVCNFSYGQAANQVFVTDTVKGAETKYCTGTKAASIYQGVSGFVFETSHGSDTTFLQGCYDTDSWFFLDTAIITGTAVMKWNLYEAPPLYKYYRLMKKGIVGDTCIYTNTRHYLKY